jgi:hypothetical protein
MNASDKNALPSGHEWLRAEGRNDDVLAEAMFASLVAELPAVEPSAAFVARLAEAGWRSRSRRRWVTTLAAVAASVLVTVSIGGFAWALSGIVLDLVVSGSVLLSRLAVWLITSASSATDMAGRLVDAVAEAVDAPSTIAAISGVAALAIIAIVAFSRLLSTEFAAREIKRVRI